MISVFAVDKVQLINTVINRVFHNCVGRIKLYVMDRVNMYFLGHGACPTWESCFLNMGTLLSPDGQNCFPKVARYGHYIHVYVYKIKTTVNRGEFSSYYTL